MKKSGDKKIIIKVEKKVVKIKSGLKKKGGVKIKSRLKKNEMGVKKLWEKVRVKKKSQKSLKKWG